jgi:hypothetical protein
MTGRAPRYPTGEVVAQVVLDPNGDHRLEVTTTGGIMVAAYGADAVRKLAEAIEQFRTLTIHADGGRDFYHPKRISLEL